jgi:deoxyribodipyrimidine photolyase-like uncharacterized protein
MKTLRFVLGDQLSRSLSALRDVEISQDVVLMVEAHEETTYVRHHRQKIALVLSAMRHFAESLRAEGLRVDYVRLDDAGNSGSFTGELGRALSRHPVDRVVVTQFLQRPPAAPGVLLDGRDRYEVPAGDHRSYPPQCLRASHSASDAHR